MTAPERTARPRSRRHQIAVVALLPGIPPHPPTRTTRPPPPPEAPDPRRPPRHRPPPRPPRVQQLEEARPRETDRPDHDDGQRLRPPVEQLDGLARRGTRHRRVRRDDQPR